MVQQWPHGGCYLLWANIHEGGGWASVQRAEQSQKLLLGMDPQQCQDGHLQHPFPWPQDGSHLHWQQHDHQKLLSTPQSGSLPRSASRPSSTGTQVRKRIRWSSLRLRATWTTSSPNTDSTRMPPQKRGGLEWGGQKEGLRPSPHDLRLLSPLSLLPQLPFPLPQHLCFLTLSCFFILGEPVQGWSSTVPGT